MTLRATKTWYLFLGLAACAGQQHMARVAPLPAAGPASAPATAVVAAPDPGRAVTDSAAPAATVRSEDVEREAVRLFGPEGREIVGAQPADATSTPTYDIDVTSYAANRRVLEYLEFFQVDARDRMTIWLSRLSRYEGMIRDRLRAKGLPEDLVYLTLIESGLSNSAVSRARAVGMWQFVAGTAGSTGSPSTLGWTSAAIPSRRPMPPRTTSRIWCRSSGASIWPRPPTTPARAGSSGACGGLPGEADSLTDETFFQLASTRYPAPRDP